MPGMELTSHSADWAMVADHEVTFAGSAQLNGRGGLRYEARAEVTGDSGQRRLTLRVWSRAGHEEFPLFLGFGDLTSGSITWLDHGNPLSRHAVFGEPARRAACGGCEAASPANS